MTEITPEWRPGSFTKNYSWGPPNSGLMQLHHAIRMGFEGRVENVPREKFRSRIAKLGRPDYIPTNFFLFNQRYDSQDWIVADELVFQAVKFPHSKRFDSLAIFAFNLSLAGDWKGAKQYQQRPAMWAHHYISERLGRDFQWDASRINADDIQMFVAKNPRYTGEGSRKLATNLAYLYRQASLDQLGNKKVDRWWVDALFLTLDRVLLTRLSQKLNYDTEEFENYLSKSGFFQISGKRSIEKNLASKHLVRLYEICGGIARFSNEAVRDRSLVLLKHIANYIDDDIIGAVHPTNYRMVKMLPQVCSALARYAGFETFSIEDLESMNTSEIARVNVMRALIRLQQQGVTPNISSEELMAILRGE